MSAVGRVVRSGVGRRKVSTLVMCVSTMIAVAASITAGSLIVVSQAPFDHAFAQQNGAHLMAQFDGSKATTAQIAATAHVPGVTAAVGPFAEAAVDDGVTGGTYGNQHLGALTIAGRAAPGGPVDDVTLTDGRWVTGPGQIVVSDQDGDPGMVGTSMSFPGVPGAPSLTVVGIARSVSQTADAWVTPSQVAALRSPRAAPAYEMLYRFAQAGDDAQIAADRAAVTAALPRGAVTGTQSYLTVKTNADNGTAPFIPFIVAFGILGLVMSVLIVGTVVSGAVGAGIRRIGVLKSLGFTPGQVVRAYVAQALIPSAAGVVGGVVLGNLLAVVMLRNAENTYGTASLSVAAWIDVAVPAVMLGVVVVTALVPALRAGRLSAIQAIVLGRTPDVGRGRIARRMLGRLPLPRPVSLGLAGPFARPLRALSLAAAIVFGVTAVTFAVGLVSSLNAVKSALHSRNNADATVMTIGDGPGQGPAVAVAGPSGQPQSANPAAVAAVIRAQPGTGSFYGITHDQLNVPGVTGAVNVTLFDGDASHTYDMISGSWFTGPGQAVVPTGFLQITGTHIGDTVTIIQNGRGVPVRIVGEAFDTENSGKDILTDAATLGGQTTANIDQFNVTVKPGTDVATYRNSLATALGPTGAGIMSLGQDGGGELAAMDAMIVLLTLMLVSVAGLGVLNSVVLDTRERVHDLGVYKAIGMTPRQTIALVVASVAGVGLVAGVVGVPLGMALHDYVLPVMGHAAGTDLPPNVVSVYHAFEPVLLGLGGVVIAVLGALLPAGWAAGTRTATALRTE